MQGIWIRSQDKRSLVFAKRIGILDSQRKLSVIETLYFDGDVHGYDTLGTYSTEAKVLKVMDWIEAKIQRIKRTELGALNVFTETYVYDMPADSEVEA